MRLLLDTHALLWWLVGDERLSLRARRAIEDQANITTVSAVSGYEIALKHQLGRLPEATPLLFGFETVLEGQRFETLPIALAHSTRAGQLPLTHRDPFDRLLIAQALLGEMTLISNERLFDDFGVNRLW